ncbi:MAG: hypothetical protein WC868_05305 [Bacteroidales bacterium]
MNKYDLEERLINFAVLIVEIVGTMPDTKAAKHLNHFVIPREIVI